MQVSVAGVALFGRQLVSLVVRRACACVRSLMGVCVRALSQSLAEDFDTHTQQGKVPPPFVGSGRRALKLPEVAIASRLVGDIRMQCPTVVRHGMLEPRELCVSFACRCRHNHHHPAARQDWVDCARLRAQGTAALSSM